MSLQMKKILITGLLIFGCLSKVSQANPINDEEDMQMDYYQYDSDDDPPLQSKAPELHQFVAEKLSFAENNLKLTVEPGGNITLSCPVQNIKVPENHVRIWFKDNNTLTTGKHSLKDDYALNNEEGLVITNASAEIHSGDYFCVIQPEKLRLHINLVVGDRPDASSGTEQLTPVHLLLSSVFGVLLFLRI